MEKTSARKYTAKFKLQIVSAAEQTNNNVQAAKLYGIGESCLKLEKTKRKISVNAFL